LGQKEVSALDDVLEVGFAVGVDERCYIRDIDSFRSEKSKRFKIEFENKR